MEKERSRSFSRWCSYQAMGSLQTCTRWGSWFCTIPFSS